jgi:serpin B
MKTLLIACLCLLAMFAVACGNRGQTPAPPPPPSPDAQALSGANTEFGLELLRNVHEAGTNLAVSPLSVAMALQLAAMGAEDATLAEMLEVLRTGGLDLAASNRSLLNSLAPSGDVTLNIANSVWVDPARMSLKPDFVKTAADHFDAAAREADFGNPATVDVINAWVSERTNGRIDELLDSISQAVGAYLINAVYFKGAWQEAFKPEATLDRDFHRLDGETISIPTMTRKEGFDALRENGTTVVRLRFGKDNRASMLFVLPDAESSVEALLNGLTTEQISRWQGGLRPSTLELELPRFTLRTKLELSGTLKAMGMPRAFSETEAQFGALGSGPGGEGLYISRVLHEVFVEVNEEGAEAAAATAVEMEVLSMPESIEFNRPFAFMIMDDTTGGVLFAGAVYDPSA